MRSDSEALALLEPRLRPLRSLDVSCPKVLHGLRLAPQNHAPEPGGGVGLLRTPFGFLPPQSRSQAQSPQATARQGYLLLGDRRPSGRGRLLWLATAEQEPQRARLPGGARSTGGLAARSGKT